jgi:hypothetical protein
MCLIHPTILGCIMGLSAGWSLSAVVLVVGGDDLAVIALMGDMGTCL